MTTTVRSTLICSAGCEHRIDLLLDQHPNHAAGVLRVAGSDRQILARMLHDDRGIRIKTTDPRTVCAALGICYPNMQISLVSLQDWQREPGEDKSCVVSGMIAKGGVR